MINLGEGFLVGLFQGQVQENLALVDCFGQLIVPIQFCYDSGSFFQDGFGILGVIPEAVFGDLLFNLGQSFFFGSGVKDSP